MTALIPSINQSIVPNRNFSLHEARALKEESLWENLKNISLEQSIGLWLDTLSLLTRLNYQSAFGKLIELGMLDPLVSLQAFALINGDGIVDRIKQIDGWSETTRQARAAAFISFTRFLSRRTEGVIKKAQPSREGVTKTFFRVHEKVASKAMTQSEWTLFFQELQKINPRDCLIGKIMLQGGKRANEVLKLTSDRVDFDKRQITFLQSKAKGLIKETVITYPESIMNQLREYIEDREGLVFITRGGNPVLLTQIAITFAKAGKRAGLGFKITPHTLRASAVTYLKQQGFRDTDIMKITGHSSSEMVYAYDKSDRADNPSKSIALIT